MFVATIRNQALGKCFLVDNWEEGVSEIIKIVQSENRRYSYDDNVRLVDTGEYYNDESPDDVVTFAIGSMDNE